MTTLAVIQARMGSLRFPGKVLQKIDDFPILELLAMRIKLAKHVDQIVIATSELTHDDVIEAKSHSLNINVIRGSENDLLARFLKALSNYPAECVVRVTADNPFTDPRLLDAAIELFRKAKCDYVHVPDAPIGTTADVFSAESLTLSHQNADSQYEREHINAHILNNPNFFNIKQLSVPKNLQRSDIEFTIDTEAQLESLNDFNWQDLNLFEIDTATLIKLYDERAFLKS
jgi:spore coat polysaccharide biosynthesis protein SpsF